MKNKLGQQEMVGFVLIVVLVVVGLMVFLVVSLRSSPEAEDSLEVGNMLSALMRFTTDCAPVYEPAYDSLEDLFKRCHKEGRCKNLGKDACDVLNESLEEIVGALLKSEATVEAYQVDFFVKDGGEGILRVYEGNCSSSGKVSSAQRSIFSGSEDLLIRIKICESS